MADSTFIRLKDNKWLENQRVAGKCVAKILKAFTNTIKNTQNIIVKDLEFATSIYFEEFDCQPTFLNYKGFPAPLCISVNEILVHGIASDYKLQPGDKISMDVGATYKGAIADAATTVFFGDPPSEKAFNMVKLCKEALDCAIKAVEIDKQIGVVGNAINSLVKNSEFGLITEYGGHGIDTNIPHAPPFVMNKSRPSEGVRIQPGFTFAIEPMLVLTKDTTTEILSDGWSVKTKTVGAHFEHTVFVTENGVEVITCE